MVIKYVVTDSKGGFCLTDNVKAGIRIKDIFFLGFLAAMAPLSTDMYLPGLPQMTTELGVGASLIQLTLTMSMAGMAIGQLLAGPVSDHFGRKYPSAAGMAVFMLSSLGCAMASDIISLLVMRLIQGLSGAFGIVTARAVARDLYTGADLTKFFSLLMLVNGITPVLGPVVGGQILYFVSWRGVFVFLCFVGLVLMLGSLRMDETLPAERRIKSMGGSFKSFGELLHDRAFFGQCLVQCFFFSAFFSYIAGSSFVFQNIYGISPQEYSILFGAIGIVVGIFGVVPARLAGRVRDISLLRYALSQGLVGSILFAIVVWLHGPFAAAVGALLVAVPIVSVMGASSFSMAMRTQGKKAGSAAALIGFFSMISGGIMAPLVGIMGEMDARPMAVLMVCGTLGALLCCEIFVALSEKKKSDS